VTAPEPAAKTFAIGASIVAAAAVVVAVAITLIGSTSSTPRVGRAANATPASSSPGVLAAASASSAATPSATGATQVVAYSPYVDGKLSPELTVSTTDTAADCTAILHDPWPLRCMSSDGVPDPVTPAQTDAVVTYPVYDPCFPTDDATSCLFVESPTSATAVRVSLGAPEAAAIPSPPATWPGYSAATPWAIELSDSTVCVFVNGAEDNVDGLRPQDRCSDGRYLFGDPDETATAWNVKVGASQSGPLTGTATIAKVWIFRP
jgi:hypothetical protein